MKKASKAKKLLKKKASKKALSKKKAPLKKVSSKKASSKKAPPMKASLEGAPKAAKRKAALGCCTLTGSGPDVQFEGITKADCRQRAIAAGKNDHWVPGQCAEPG
jgi:hypothetical protein